MLIDQFLLILVHLLGVVVFSVDLLHATLAALGLPSCAALQTELAVGIISQDHDLLPLPLFEQLLHVFVGIVEILLLHLLPLLPHLMKPIILTDYSYHY